jgi:hypothetical protein
MILINLLPPELRKSGGGVNPVVVSIAAGASVCLLLFCFFAWVSWVKIPAARKLLAEKAEVLRVKTEEAERVEAMRAQIAEFEALRTALLTQLSKKVYWAHTLDDFATLLAGDWQGYHVRCLELSAMPASGDRKGESANSFRVRLQLVGDERTKSGDYIKSFFHRITESTFWKQNGFVGKSEDTYFGENPVWNSELGKIVISFNLEFQRVKSINKPKAGG